jgi:hypothetical protein
VVRGRYVCLSSAHRSLIKEIVMTAYASDDDLPAFLANKVAQVLALV